MNFASDFIDKVVILERVVDYYVFTMFRKFTDHISNRDVKFIPGADASELNTLISLALGFSNNFVVFLDNDQAGKSALKKYTKEFGDEIKDYIMNYNSNTKNTEVEDLFCKCDRMRIIDTVGTKDFKKALIKLNFEDDKAKEIFSTLSEETKKRFGHVFSRINAL